MLRLRSKTNEKGETCITTRSGFLLTEMTIRALAMAEKVHRNQTDLMDVPYILHVISTAQNVPQDELHVTVALLHNTLEDSPMTCEQIEQMFNDQVADLVEKLTRSPHESYAAYIERCAASPVTRAVKMADILDHLAEYRATGLDESLRRRYNSALCVLIEEEPHLHLS